MILIHQPVRQADDEDVHKYGLVSRARVSHMDNVLVLLEVRPDIELIQVGFVVKHA